MPKILVADDNSNVQKTVTLALADLGIDVVAVNNGEAAVRKLPDVSPDLVLADIFMPVRNGYEVCEYVKKDARFANVPVVLLVGAFDPLDEREAQRVGADGILKKPFVPPEPLISMVKMLLERTMGDRLVAVGAAKPAVAAQSKATEGKSGGVATAERPPAAQVSEELSEPEEEFPAPIARERLSFGEGARPMAFGQLLDTPVEEASAPALAPVADEEILTSSRDASLGDPIFWKTEEPERESSEENSDTESDLDASDAEKTSSLPVRPWTPDVEANARNAEAEAMQPVEPFELVRDDNEESAQNPTVVESSELLVQDAAAQAALTVEAGKAEDLAANPIEWMASVPPPPAEDLPEASAETELDSGLAGSVQPAEEAEPVQPNSSVEPVSSEVVSPQSSVGSESVTSVLGSATAEAVAPVGASSEEAKNAAAPEIRAPEKTHPSLNTVAQSTEAAARSIARQDWADLAASLQPQSPANTSPKTESETVSSPQGSVTPAVAENTSSAEAQAESRHSSSTQASPADPSTEDTARSITRQEWADLTATAESHAVEKLAAKSASESSETRLSAAATNESAKSPENFGNLASVSRDTETENSAPATAARDWSGLASSLRTLSVEANRKAVTDNPAGAAAGNAAVNGSLSEPSPFSELASVAQSAVADVQASASSSSPAPQDAAGSSSSGSPDPVLVEAVVQRILEKWRPQVVDIITKEFLRPIVQALVQREILKR